MASFKSKISLMLSHARYVKHHYGRGFYAQLLDLITLYRINPTCNLFDYYKYQVYSVARGAALYNELLGTSALEAFSRSLNPRNAVSPAWDKMLFAMLCDAYKLPIPETIALYKPSGEFPKFVPNQLSEISQIKVFLKQNEGPIFVKPVKGSLGQGAFFIAEVDKNCDRIVDKSGNIISFDEFINKTIKLSGAYHYKPNAGVMFQRPVIQHQEITAFTQTDTPSGLRILVLNTGSGPYIHRAIWKVIAPGNISDNFSKGKHGNMVVQVNPINGTLSDAVDGYWPTTKLHSTHPISGRSFRNFTLPLWTQVVDDVLRASRAVNDMGAMHWDVVIAESGAVLLELNDIGSTEFLQLHGQGLVDRNFKAKLKQMAALQPGTAFARFIMREER